MKLPRFKIRETEAEDVIEFDADEVLPVPKFTPVPIGGTHICQRTERQFRGHAIYVPRRLNAHVGTDDEGEQIIVFTRRAE